MIEFLWNIKFKLKNKISFITYTKYNLKVCPENQLEYSKYKFQSCFAKDVLNF